MLLEMKHANIEQQQQLQLQLQVSKHKKDNHNNQKSVQLEKNRSPEQQQQQSVSNSNSNSDYIKVICISPYDVNCIGFIKPIVIPTTSASSSPPLSTQTNTNIIPTKRHHLCKHVDRLIGKYKIVYFMQCVRVLWPLRPANFLKIDQAKPQGLTNVEKSYIYAFHNISAVATADISSLSTIEDKDMMTIEAAITKIVLDTMIYPPITTTQRDGIIKL